VPDAAATGGAAPPDAAVDVALDSIASDAPASAGACAGKFCDDFEAFAPGTVPADVWKTHLEGDGKLAVDDSKAFSGSRSVRFDHQTGMAVAMFLELRQPALPPTGDVVYGRLMYQLTKNPTGTFSHFEIVRGTGPLGGGQQAQLNTGAENGKAVINYEPGDCTKYSKVVPFPEKRWTCYQWKFDRSTGEIHIWVDGMSVDDTKQAPEAGGCWKPPTAVDTLHIGWESYHTPVPVQLWIDDVAVGETPIPCPPGPPSKP
jgi:hypothetical protein